VKSCKFSNLPIKIIKKNNYLLGADREERNVSRNQALMASKSVDRAANAIRSTSLIAQRLAKAHLKVKKKNSKNVHAMKENKKIR
jgi:hypothetical protein